MLNDLIFLGQIPGTNFYLTFYEIEMALRLTELFGLVFVALWILMGGRPVFALPTISLRIPRQPAKAPIRPLQAIGRISLIPPEDNDPEPIDPFVFPIPQDA